MLKVVHNKEHSEISDLSEDQLSLISGGCPVTAFIAGVSVGIVLVGLAAAAARAE